MSALPERPTMNQLYQWWWIHDGRWYQEVAQRFGYDAANEINKRALKFVASRVAQAVAKSLGKPITDMAWADVVDAFETCPKLMWPGGLVEFTYAVTGPGAFEVNLTRNFALTMLQRAGSLDKYECPCLELREGWFEGLGLTPLENRIDQCLRTGGTACTYTGRVAGFSPEPGDDPRSP